MNNIYRNLNTITFLKKSYLLKFLFIAFIGIHIPLISIVVFVLVNDEVDKLSVVVVSLLFTLIATGVTLLVLKNLLSPLISSRIALEEYLRHQTLPVLPEDFKDEAGRLMHLINKSVNSIDNIVQEKQQVTALLSHNLRVPFNQIKGLCDVLETINPINVKVIEKINLICDYQLKNINELLQNLNNQINKGLSLITPVSLKQFIEEEISMFATEASNKQIVMQTSFPDNDIIVNTDKSKLSLVLQNLITNAIKFSYPGKTICISLEEVADKVNINVKDEGIGFPEKYEKNIFSASPKLGRIGTAGEPSNGVGLNLSKKTMQQLGGDLDARSEGVDKGAEFIIVI